MVYYYCMVPCCKNTTVTAKEKTFIMLPSDEKRRMLWLEAARRDPTDISSKSSLFICEDHFDLENDMENYMEWKVMGVQKRMKKDIVPHKFACQPDRQAPVEGPSRGVVSKRTKPRIIRKPYQPNRKRAVEGPSRGVVEKRTKRRAVQDFPGDTPSTSQERLPSGEVEKRTKRRAVQDVPGDTPSTSQEPLPSGEVQLIKLEQSNNLEDYDQPGKSTEDNEDNPCFSSQEFMEDIPEYVVINHLTPDRLIKVGPQEEVKIKESPHTKTIKLERSEGTEDNKYTFTQTTQKEQSVETGNNGCTKSKPIKEEPPEESETIELIQTFKEELTESIDIKEEITEDTEDTEYSYDEPFKFKQESRDSNEGPKYASAGVQANLGPEMRTISIQCSLSPTSDSRSGSPLLLDSRSNSPLPQDFRSSSPQPQTSVSVGLSPIKLERNSWED